MVKRLPGFFFALCGVAFLTLYTLTLLQPRAYRVAASTRSAIFNSSSTDAGVQTEISHGLTGDSNGSCHEVNNLVFIKTHKTGSTTLASIIQRFGYLRNLSFVLNPHSHILTSQLFHRKLAVKSPPPLDLREGEKITFNILTSHARYSRREIEAVIRPGAKYVTIIRDPVANLESAFGYFQLAKRLDLTEYRNPYNMFIRRLEEFSRQTFFRRPYIRNGQMYDLGLNTEQQMNISHVQRKIQDFSTEFDLVLIQEYYDESLVLLKNLLCWDFNDILYIPKGVRSKTLRYNYDRGFDNKIRQWSLADSMLYEHFNKTLWRKIRSLGEKFYRDLDTFRRKQQEVFRTCVSDGVYDTTDRREEKFVLVANASVFCQLLRLEDTQYWKMLGHRQMIAALRRMNFTLNFK